jgi:hypothetical protein
MMSQSNQLRREGRRTREANNGRPIVSLGRQVLTSQAILISDVSWREARGVSAGLSLPRVHKSGFVMRGSIPAADVADKADNTVTGLPSLTTAELPRFLIGGADECPPLRGLRLFGGARRRTHVDHEIIVVNGFHEDALKKTNVRVLPDELIEPTSMSDRQEINGLSKSNQEKTPEFFPFGPQGNLSDRSDWFKFSNVPAFLEINDTSCTIASRKS